MFNIYDYDIIEKCYENLEGSVYKASNKKNSQKVLLKKLKGPTNSSNNILIQESELLKNLSFKSLIPFSFLENESAPVFALKEYPLGESLEILLSQDQLNLKQKEEIAFAVFSAIQSLHEQGMICLDLQPANIWTDEHIANIQFIDGSSIISLKNNSLTRNSPSLLSPFYQSPELTGRIATNPDHRSDYYSFGIFLYELYCGRKPFFGNNVANIMYLQLTQLPLEPVRVNSRIGLGLSNLIMRLLNKNPDKRYNTSLGIKKDLERAFQLIQDSDFNTAFDLANFDVSETMTLSGELFGKDIALHQLIEYFDVLQRNSKSQFIEIIGEKGTGKSTLIHAFEKYLFHNDILFVKGSFANDHKIPYSGLRETCSQLIKVLLSMPEDQLEIVRKEIIEKGGPALNILSDFLPEFSSFISVDPDQQFTELSSKNESLAYVISIFLSAVAVHQKHLVLIWEDFQWADNSSIKLLDNLYYQDSFSCIMGIALLRKGDLVPVNTPPLRNISGPDESQFFSIAIQALSSQETEQWVKQSRLDPEIISIFSKKIFTETGGNPALIVELLDQINQNERIKKNEKGQWTLDSKKIKGLEFKIDTDEERARKARLFSKNESQIFRLAVSLMQPFKQTYLSKGSGLDPLPYDQALSTLFNNKYLQKSSHIASSEDIWLEYSDHGFANFIKSQISSEETDQINFSIAKLLCENQNPKITELYEALSFILKLPASSARNFTNILMEGARAASREAAFQTSLNYLLKIIESCTAEEWNENPEYCFDLYYKSAETSIWALDDITYNQQLEILKPRANTPYKTAKICLLEMQYSTKNGKYQEVIDIGRKGLIHMNIQISTHPSLFNIISSLVKLNIKVGRKTIEDLEKIKTSSDPEEVLMLLILEAMFSAIFLAKPEMLPEVMSTQIRRALKVGFSDSIGIAFMAYAFILTSFNPNYRKAKSVADISFFLHKKFNNPYPLVASKFIYGVFVQHWFHSLRDSKKLLEETYLSGRQVGNINLAFYALVLSEIHNLFSGTSLKEVLERSLQFNQFATNQKEKLSKEYFYLIISFCEELREPSFREMAYKGIHNEIEEIRDRHKKANNYSSILLIELFQNIIELLNENSLGGESYLKLLKEGTGIIGKGSYQLSIGYLIGGLKLTRQITPLTKSQEGLVRYALSYLELCSKQIPVNHGAKYYCLKASYSRKQGKLREALDNINKAIDYAIENHLIIEEALSLEEKYNIQTEWKQTRAAQESLKSAYLAFEKWGVLPKLNKLRQQQSIIFIDKNQVYSVDKENYFQFQGNPDISNLIKASNSITGEIKLEQLLEKMFLILAETAGAQTIVLLVKEEEKWKVFTHKNESLTEKLLSEKATENELPMSIIHYVRRSKQVILIHDISGEPLFKKDPYFEIQAKASVLCLPLLKNRDLLGIVYMENEITKGSWNFVC